MSDRITEDTKTMTPRELAVRWGVKVDIVLGFIREGELIAINLATEPNRTRPRWKIPLTEVTRFEVARSSKPPMPKQTHRRRQAVTAGREFF